jgi:plasmid stabilization system protein ParE
VLADRRRIASFWAVANPAMLPEVLAAVNARVAWIASGNHLLGTRIGGLEQIYRNSLESRFGYKIYYRLEGDPPDTIAVFAIRHGRQRPLEPRTLARYARS